MKRALLSLVIVTGVAGIPLFAHHAFAAHYLEGQTMSVEGELVEWEYRNPHAWVHVTAPDSIGTLQRYSAEWASPSRLNRQGITKDTLKPGDHVIVTGSPGRNAADRTLHLKRIERPADGWKWTGGRERR